MRLFRRHAALGVQALDFDTTNWQELEAADAQSRLWAQPQALLSLTYHPGPPGLPHAVGDDGALFAQFQSAVATKPNMALVEAGWIPGSSNLTLARNIFKVRPRSEGTNGGMTYAGSLFVLFTSCSWELIVQASEASPTGQREALWFQRFAASGGDIGAILEGARSSNDSAPSVIRRVPADDPEWDDLVPDHPLTRVRSWLASFAATVTVAENDSRLQRFT